MQLQPRWTRKLFIAFREGANVLFGLMVGSLVLKIALFVCVGLGAVSDRAMKLLHKSVAFVTNISSFIN